MTEGALGKQIARLLVKTGELKRRLMRNLLHNLGLHRGQPAVLRALWKQDGVTQSELTELLNRSPSTITKTVKRMERAGFVERKSDAADERLSRVYLTEEGWNVRTALENIWRTFEEQTFAGFDEEELVILHRLLVRVYHNLSKEAGSG